MSKIDYTGANKTYVGGRYTLSLRERITLNAKRVIIALIILILLGGVITIAVRASGAMGQPQGLLPVETAMTWVQGAATKLAPLV